MVFFFPKQSLEGINTFFQVPATVYSTRWTVELFSNFNRCPERLGEGIVGQTLRKDDSCDSPLAIYINYLSIHSTKDLMSVLFCNASCKYIHIVLYCTVYTIHINAGRHLCRNPNCDSKILCALMFFALL